MQSLLLFVAQVDIDKKLQDAPDDSYGIGVFIGTMLPFVILVALAYFIYRYNKRKYNKN